MIKIINNSKVNKVKFQLGHYYQLKSDPNSLYYVACVHIDRCDIVYYCLMDLCDSHYCEYSSNIDNLAENPDQFVEIDVERITITID